MTLAALTSPGGMLSRRRALGFAAPLLLGGCGERAVWHDINVTGTSPDLRFALDRAPDGRGMTHADCRGAVTLLYFGYTCCPDACPLTMQNTSLALDRVGKRGDADIRVLFVSVDPGRDTLPILAEYVGLFGPEFVGLRGSADQLARLARRFRVAYDVTPASPGHPETVTHTSILYVFDRDGRARLIVPSLDTPTPDIGGLAGDLRRLLVERSGPSWIERLV